MVYNSGMQFRTSKYGPQPNQDKIQLQYFAVVLLCIYM